MTARQCNLSWQELVVESKSSHNNSDSWTYQFSDEWFGIVTPLQGTCHIEGIDSQGWRCTTLMPGEVCRVSPNSLIRLSRIPPRLLPFEIACIKFPVAILQQALAEYPTTPVRDVSELHTLRTFDPLVASMAPALLHARTMGAGECYRVSAAQYLVAYLIHPLHDTSPNTEGLSSERLTAVRMYMEMNLSAPITLDQLAKEAGLSQYHFLRRFSASTGKTPLQYLTGLRIDAARHLLVQDSDPISQVGRRCGFPNPENFARVFRKHVGCSPSQYRQRSQSGPSPKPG